jgi:hypothetical protein
MANNRINYPIVQLATRWGSGNVEKLEGVQDFSYNLTLNYSDPVFEMSCGNTPLLYDQPEGRHEVNGAITKILDGRPLLFTLFSLNQSNGPELHNRIDSEGFLQVGYWEEEDSGAIGLPKRFTDISGIYINSISYNFNINEPFTEEINFSASHIASQSGSGDYIPWDYSPISGIESLQSPYIKYNTLRFSGPSGCYTYLPSSMFGVTNSGEKTDLCRIQSISVSATINREQLDGVFLENPRSTRIVTFPIEVNTEITVIAVSGSDFNILDDALACASKEQTKNEYIRVVSCDGTFIDLGDKNRLTSLGQSNGGVDGSNVILTYNYITYNNLTILHTEDINSSGFLPACSVG